MQTRPDFRVVCEGRGTAFSRSKVRRLPKHVILEVEQSDPPPLSQSVVRTPTKTLDGSALLSATLPSYPV